MVVSDVMDGTVDAYLAMDELLSMGIVINE